MTTFSQSQHLADESPLQLRRSNRPWIDAAHSWLTRRVFRYCLIAACLLNLCGAVIARGTTLPGPSGPPGPPGDTDNGDRECRNSSESDAEVQEDADPVDIHTGEFILERTDVALSGRGRPLEFAFTYRSQSAYAGPYGFGWDLSLHRRLRRLQNGDLVLVQGSRHFHRFQSNGNGTYTSPIGIQLILFANADGSFLLTHRDGRKEHYDADGKLARLEDRHGNAIVLTYDPAGPLPVFGPSEYFADETNGVLLRDYRLMHVLDTVGRDVDLSYDANGHLESISYLGRTITYEYDADGNLVRVTAPSTAQFPAGTTTTYAYANHNLTAITDGKRQTYLTNSYDSADRVVQQTFGPGTSSLEYGFDAGGNETTLLTDRHGNETLYRFDAVGRITRLEQYTDGVPTGEPASYVTTRSYDLAGRLIREVLPRNNASEFSYSPDGELTEWRRKGIGATPFVPDESDILACLTYEPLFGFVKTITDPLGRVTMYTYDYELNEAPHGDVRRIRFPTAGIQTPELLLGWNALGELETVVDPNGNVERRSYDVATGQVSQIVQGFGTSDAAVTAFAYDAVGNLTSVRDPSGNVTTIEHDAHDQVTTVTSPPPFSYQAHYRYDANGNVVQVDRQAVDSAPGSLPPLGTTNPTDGWRSAIFAYTALDQLASTRDELGRTVMFGYDANGNPVSVRDPAGFVTTFDFDERDLVQREIDAAIAPGVTEYGYDANGNVVSIRDATGKITRFAVDDFDRTVSTTYADDSSGLISYDAASNVTRYVTPGGQTISFFYDELDRLISKTAPPETSTFIYDPGGRLLTATDSDASLTFAYDPLDRVRAATTTFAGDSNPRTVEYTYDRRGLRVSIGYPDGLRLAYAYDELGRLTQVEPARAYAGTPVPAATMQQWPHVGRPIARFAYDALNRRTQIERRNDLVTQFSYDGADQVTSVVHERSSGVFESVAYSHDQRGNVVTRTDLSGVHTYQYDALSQLDNATYPSGFPFPSTTWTYDAVGNRVTSSDGSTTTSYVTNALNQYTSIGTLTLSYDGNGNLQYDGSNEYAYDTESRLVRVIGVFGRADYSYDALGRRISRTVNGSTTRFVYDGQAILEEVDGTGNPAARYVHGVRLDEPITMVRGGATYFYATDHLGSIAWLTDDGGAAVERYRYDTFGRTAIETPQDVWLPTSAFANRFMFTGRELETDSGLYHYRARELLPSIGRFAQRDPLGMFADINVYRYVGNNPLTFVDPFGLAKAHTSSVWDELKEFWGIVVNGQSLDHQMIAILSDPTIPQEEKDAVLPEYMKLRYAQGAAAQSAIEGLEATSEFVGGWQQARGLAAAKRLVLPKEVRRWLRLAGILYNLDGCD